MLSKRSVGIISNNFCFFDRANRETARLRPCDFLKPWAIVSIGGLSSSIKMDKTKDTSRSASLPSFWLYVTIEHSTGLKKSFIV